MSTILSPDAYLGTIQAHDMIDALDSALLDGGFTVTVTDDGRLVPARHGYAVALLAPEEDDDPLPTDGDPRVFFSVMEIWHALYPNAALGGWVGGPCELYVEPVEIVDGRKAAKKLGRKRHQTAIFDLDTGTEIRL